MSLRSHTGCAGPCRVSHRGGRHVPCVLRCEPSHLGESGTPASMPFRVIPAHGASQVTVPLWPGWTQGAGGHAGFACPSGRDKFLSWWPVAPRAWAPHQCGRLRRSSWLQPGLAAAVHHFGGAASKQETHISVSQLCLQDTLQGLKAGGLSRDTGDEGCAGPCPASCLRLPPREQQEPAGGVGPVLGSGSSFPSWGPSWGAALSTQCRLQVPDHCAEVRVGPGHAERRSAEADPSKQSTVCSSSHRHTPGVLQAVWGPGIGGLGQVWGDGQGTVDLPEEGAITLPVS